ncbi:MAG: tetratricopeptide repeat protein, partial [Candidatus Hydrogenedentes bacterium]|nr:tetratricopeptide repeat protein [Candidatus Hydrogenedentota bacterium]
VWPLLREKWALFALAAASCALTMYAATVWGAVGGDITFPFPTRAAAACVAYVVYLGKALWPVHLAAYYPHPGDTLPLWQPIAAVALLVSISAAVLVSARKRPYLAVGWAWYLGTLLPVIGFIQIGRHWMADRYTYVPLIGLLIAGVWAVADAFSTRKRSRAALGVVAAVVVAAAAIGASLQVRCWRNSETLWRHALRVTANNHLAHSNLGSHLARQGKLEEAASHFAEAVAIEPVFVSGFYNLGLARLLQERHDEAAAAFAETLRLKPDYPNAHASLGIALFALGRRDEAEACFRRALEVNPGDTKARENLDRLLAQEAPTSPGAAASPP